MTIINIIKDTYPEITDQVFISGVIKLQDDADGKGVFIAEWNYTKPIPDSLSLGK